MEQNFSTKVVSVRIPMTDYIKFMDEAQARNLSFTELLLQKIYSPANTPKQNESNNNSASASSLKEQEQETENSSNPAIDVKKNRRFFDVLLGRH